MVDLNSRLSWWLQSPNLQPKPRVDFIFISLQNYLNLFRMLGILYKYSFCFVTDQDLMCYERSWKTATLQRQRASPHVNADLYDRECIQTVVAAVTLFVPTQTADTRGQRQQETRAKTKQRLWRSWPDCPCKTKSLHLHRLHSNSGPAAPCLKMSFLCIQWHLQPLCNQWLGWNNYGCLLSDVTAWDATIDVAFQWPQSCFCVTLTTWWCLIALLFEHWGKKNMTDKSSSNFQHREVCKWCNCWRQQKQGKTDSV